MYHAPLTPLVKAQRTEGWRGGNISDLPGNTPSAQQLSSADIQDMGQRDLYEHWYYLHMIITLSQ